MLPEEVCQNYRVISYGLAGDWKLRLQRYSVNTIVMDHMSHAEMIDALRQDPEWERTYEDRLGAVFVRRQPI